MCTNLRSRSALDGLDAQIARLLDTEIPPDDKASPGFPITPRSLATQHWRVPSRELPLPLLTVDRTRLQANIATLQRFADDEGVWLAPHGKTTMAPQIFKDQLDAGAWGISVATVHQLRVCARFQVPRILLANEVTSAHDLEYLALLMASADPPCIIVLADDAHQVRRLATALRASRDSHPIHVLVEVGIVDGGRTGVRSQAAALEVASAIVEGRPDLELAGIAGFEGLLPAASGTDPLAEVDEYLRHMLSTAELLLERWPIDPFVVSAGGSAYFDRVVSVLRVDRLPNVRLVLRSGAYVTHDDGAYEAVSPLGSNNRRLKGDVLRPALTLWSSVLSRPTPTLAIAGFGRRDAPFDAGLPIPRLVVRTDMQSRPAPETLRFRRLNDQHAYLEVSPEDPLGPGDSIGSGISHPCTAFDKWRTLIVVDDERNVVGAIRTFF